MPEFNSLVRLTKYEALGNDYLVVDEVDRFELAIRLAVTLCDRHRGVGADGVLLVDPAARAVRIINPDGSEAEKSGNGLRIAAAHLVLGYGLRESFELWTPAGSSPVRVLSFEGGLVTTSLGLGVPRVGSRERLESAGVEGVEGVEGVAVDVGNPHFVVFGDEVSAGRARELGPVIERHPRFPGRTNVQFVEATPGGIRIEIWERGAGYTLASGTSAAAAAAAAMAAGMVGDQLSVVMPGGVVEVRRLGDGSLEQVAAARRVFTAEVQPGDFGS